MCDVTPQGFARYASIGQSTVSICRVQPRLNHIPIAAVSTDVEVMYRRKSDFWHVSNDVRPACCEPSSVLTVSVPSPLLPDAPIPDDHMEVQVHVGPQLAVTTILTLLGTPSDKTQVSCEDVTTFALTSTTSFLCQVSVRSSDDIPTIALAADFDVELAAAGATPRRRRLSSGGAYVVPGSWTPSGTTPALTFTFLVRPPVVPVNGAEEDSRLDVILRLAASGTALSPTEVYLVDKPDESSTFECDGLPKSYLTYGNSVECRVFAKKGGTPTTGRPSDFALSTNAGGVTWQNPQDLARGARVLPFDFTAPSPDLANGELAATIKVGNVATADRSIAMGTCCVVRFNGG